MANLSCEVEQNKGAFTLTQCVSNRVKVTLFGSRSNALFRYKTSIEQLHYNEDRNLDENQILRDADCGFVKQVENPFITGSTGSGKSCVASALGYQACVLGYRVIYANSAKLFARLKMAKADDSYIKKTAKIERRHLLILNDFGLQALDTQNRNTLMENIEDRHGKTSTINTSQVPVDK